MKPLLADKLLTQTKALPNGAATIFSTGFDLGQASKDFVADVELLIQAPALTLAMLADAATMKYSVQHDTDPAFGTAVTLATDILTQTGAGGVGAAANEVRFTLPTDVKRYVRVRAINSGAGNASTVSLTEKIVY